MGRWGWRPVTFIICVCVWIVGCSDQSEPLPERTPRSQPTSHLILRTPQRVPVDEDPALPNFVTPRAHTGAATESLLNPTALTLIASPYPLDLPRPTCYETVPGGILCFGEVVNTLDVAIKNVGVELRFYDLDGELMFEQAVMLDQWLIPAGRSAPYRLLYAPVDELYPADRFGGVEVNLLRAEMLGPAAPYPEMRVRELSTNQQANAYSIEIEISNPTPQRARLLRVVLTVRDESGRIAGYRIVELQNLAAGASTRLSVSVDTVLPAQDLSHVVHVEALP